MASEREGPSIAFGWRLTSLGMTSLEMMAAMRVTGNLNLTLTAS
jgi:hypothetical protein